jgi:hypothetical protein
MTRWWHLPFAGFAATRRWLLWVTLALVCLQLFFIVRIALMAWVSPQSTRLHAVRGMATFTCQR